MTVREAEHFCGSHHHGPVPIGLPDDGFGNAVYRPSLIFKTVVGIGTLQKLFFFESE